MTKDECIGQLKMTREIIEQGGEDWWDYRDFPVIDMAIESLIERKGKWVRTGEDGYCSLCHCDMPMFREDWDWKYCETKFCPNCGARMEGEQNE